MKTTSILFFVTIFSFSVFANNSDKNSPVEKYGHLNISGNLMLSEDGKPIVLRGMSLFWSQWMGKFYNEDALEWLVDDWKITIIRAAMGVEMDGYLENPEREFERISKIVDIAIDLGIYVIVDWHDHHGEIHTTESKEFFAKIAKKYGDIPNLIYEIYNEPIKVSWSKIVKPYAETVVKEIRKYDKDNIIVVGTPFWSQNVDEASENPLNFNNIAYSLHFYAATHKQELRDKAQIALDNGVALFCTEFGTVEASGNGDIDVEETNKWINFLEINHISWCNWAVSDKDETSAILKPNADPDGDWGSEDLNPSGNFVREILICKSNFSN